MATQGSRTLAGQPTLPPLPAGPPRAPHEIATYLAAFTNFERQRPLDATRRALGPERARALLEVAGGLTPTTPVVQVAGSKGKGSTVLWMEELLLGRGARPGAYLSPHLERLNERIRVAGRELTDAELLEELVALHPSILAVTARGATLRPTFFDLWTVLAVRSFARQGATPVLLEVGLGGPLDSTSAVPHHVAVLTAIDLEHTELLGETRTAIAAEKARIARAGTHFVLSEPHTAAGRAAAAVARAQGAHVVLVGTADARVPRTLPATQRRNLRTALTALEHGLSLASFTRAEVEAAALRIRLPGRLELLPGPPPLLIDGAHTLRSLAAFRRALARHRAGRPATVLVAFLADKDWRALLDPFRPDPDLHWIITTPTPERRLDPEPVAQFLASRFPQVTIEEQPERAVARLLACARAGQAVAITGSMHLAGKARTLWSRETSGLTPKTTSVPSVDAPGP